MAIQLDKQLDLPLRTDIQLDKYMDSQLRTDIQLDKHVDSPLKTDLLLFWSRYPHAKFTPGVIAGILGCPTRKIDVEKALETLVSAKVIEEHIQQGQFFYCLTTDSKKREPILKLSTYYKECRHPSSGVRREKITQLILCSVRQS